MFPGRHSKPIGTAAAGALGKSIGFTPTREKAEQVVSRVNPTVPRLRRTNDSCKRLETKVLNFSALINANAEARSLKGDESAVVMEPSFPEDCLRDCASLGVTSLCSWSSFTIVSPYFPWWLPVPKLLCTSYRRSVSRESAVVNLSKDVPPREQETIRICQVYFGAIASKATY